MKEEERLITPEEADERIQELLIRGSYVQYSKSSNTEHKKSSCAMWLVDVGGIGQQSGLTASRV